MHNCSIKLTEKDKQLFFFYKFFLSKRNKKIEVSGLMGVKMIIQLYVDLVG